MVRAEPHLFDFRIDCHFEWEEHVLALVSQPQAPKAVHAPHVQVLVGRHCAHVEEACVDGCRTATWIEVVAAEEGGGQLFRHSQLTDLGSEAQHTVAPGEHLTIV